MVTGGGMNVSVAAGSPHTVAHQRLGVLEGEGARATADGDHSLDGTLVGDLQREQALLAGICGLGSSDGEEREQHRITRCR